MEEKGKEKKWIKWEDWEVKVQSDRLERWSVVLKFKEFIHLIIIFLCSWRFILLFGFDPYPTFRFDTLDEPAHEDHRQKH